MADSQEKINIGKEVAALCKKLGLEPSFTRSIHLTPTQAEVVTYLKNDQGSKYTTPLAPVMEASEDEDITCFSMEPATVTNTYEVRT